MMTEHARADAGVKDRQEDVQQDQEDQQGAEQLFDPVKEKMSIHGRFRFLKMRSPTAPAAAHPYCEQLLCPPRKNRRGGDGKNL
jgi:hypothetical protein